MSSKDFTDRMKASKREDRPKTGATPSTADTFRVTAPPRVLLHRTTINIPVDLHEQMRREAFETGVSITDQLVTSWKNQRGY